MVNDEEHSLDDTCIQNVFAKNAKFNCMNIREKSLKAREQCFLQFNLTVLGVEMGGCLLGLC